MSKSYRMVRSIRHLFVNNDIFPGPCQFPTLGFVVSRYNRVQAFRPEPFWYIYLSLSFEEAETVFSWKRGHVFDETVAAVLYQYVMESPIARVTKVTQKGTKKW